ncbi:nitroreductase family protein [Candidatus Methylocalor cossyra]|uniref:Nitroreductase n=1 Tax=Candidatus Methylocalor cossyra TaxID=3108543 RepID=A0ABP1CDA8_9GAMM
MDLLEALQGRRSINFFEPGLTLPGETLRQLLETANLSPSSFNLQPWKVVVVDDPEKKKRLRHCAMNQPKVEDASVVLIIVADPQGVEENTTSMLDSWETLGYIKPEMRETYLQVIRTLYGTPESLTRKLFAVKNAALFAMNLMLAARGLGLETHPMDGFDESCIKREFGIAEHQLIPMLIAVGHLKPGITLLPRAYRRKLEDFVTFA